MLFLLRIHFFMAITFKKIQINSRNFFLIFLTVYFGIPPEPYELSTQSSLVFPFFRGSKRHYKLKLFNCSAETLYSKFLTLLTTLRQTVLSISIQLYPIKSHPKYVHFELNSPDEGTFDMENFCFTDLKQAKLDQERIYFQKMETNARVLSIFSKMFENAGEEFHHFFKLNVKKAILIDDRPSQKAPDSVSRWNVMQNEHLYQRLDWEAQCEKETRGTLAWLLHYFPNITDIEFFHFQSCKYTRGHPMEERDAFSNNLLGNFFLYHSDLLEKFELETLQVTNMTEKHYVGKFTTERYLFSNVDKIFNFTLRNLKSLRALKISSNLCTAETGSILQSCLPCLEDVDIIWESHGNSGAVIANANTTFRYFFNGLFERKFKKKTEKTIVNKNFF